MRTEAVAEFAAAVRDEPLAASVVIPRELAERLLRELPVAGAVSQVAAPEAQAQVAAPPAPRAIRRRKPTAAQQIYGLSRKPASAPNAAATAEGSEGDGPMTTEAWLAAHPGALQRLGDGEVSEASRLRKIGGAARPVRA